MYGCFLSLVQPGQHLSGSRSSCILLFNSCALWLIRPQVCKACQQVQGTMPDADQEAADLQPLAPCVYAVLQQQQKWQQAPVLFLCSAPGAT